jgi:hypothetical protein
MVPLQTAGLLSKCTTSQPPLLELQPADDFSWCLKPAGTTSFRFARFAGVRGSHSKVCSDAEGAPEIELRWRTGRYVKASIQRSAVEVCPPS